MLALPERLAADQGLNWVFCDTDSLAMAKSDNMANGEFLARGRAVIDWFEGLNPYQKPGSILEMEDTNYGIGTKEPEPLYCLAISAKRYALYNLSEDGQPILRKASAHGLGHLMAPYSEEEAPDCLPRPQVPCSALCVSRWQHDLWIKIIEAAMGPNPNQVSLDYHPAFSTPCMSRYGATSPNLLKWVETWNADKPYWEQIKPFGFMTSFTARSGPLEDRGEPSLVDPNRRGRPNKTEVPKPIAPFERNPETAVRLAFDRITGKPVQTSRLKTYAEALAQFHLSTEDKFENGDFWDVGETQRRHIHVDSVGLIGKEANKVGDSGQADPCVSAQAMYGSCLVRNSQVMVAS
ncbi:MAG: hypothetical protein ACU0C9_04275 [Paracoccaceae bacterium]